MSLGTKLQATAERVNKKLGKQGGPITFSVAALGNQRHLMDTPTSSEMKVTINEGARVEWISTHQLDKAGRFEVGDLRIIIPSNLVSEEMLKDKKLYIIYENKTYSPVQIQPTKIVSSIPVKWDIVARLSK